jgi:hypothetical protein
LEDFFFSLCMRCRCFRTKRPRGKLPNRHLSGPPSMRFHCSLLFRVFTIDVFRGIFRVADASWGLARDRLSYHAWGYANLAEFICVVTARAPWEERHGEQARRDRGSPEPGDICCKAWHIHHFCSWVSRQRGPLGSCANGGVECSAENFFIFSGRIWSFGRLRRVKNDAI